MLQKVPAVDVHKHLAEQQMDDVTVGVNGLEAIMIGVEVVVQEMYEITGEDVTQDNLKLGDPIE